MIVHQHGDRAVIAAADPEAMLGLVSNPAVGEVAREAKLRLERALATLAQP